MNISKRSDIIPILYMGGTGGHFLSAFLYHAREGDNYWQFSKNGNTHHSQKEYTNYASGEWDIAIDHITPLLQIPISDNIKYIMSHCTEPELALSYFDKVIKTYYESNDVYEITLAFLAKWGSDHNNLSIDELRKMSIPINLRHRNFPKLCKYYESDSLLNISWKELIHNDPNLLISKLSKFTSMNVERFPIDKLITWRKLTLDGISKYRTLIY
jgi:hypothetical protein